MASRGGDLPEPGRTGAELCRKVFEHSNDAIFIVDPERDEILDVNPRACRMLGYSRRELLALTMSAIHPNDMHRVVAFSRAVLADGSGWTDELRCVTKTGESLAAEISASSLEIDGRQCLIAMVRDVEERKRAVEALERQSRELEARVEERTARLRRSEEKLRMLLDIARAVSAHLEAADLFLAITEALRPVVPFDRMGVILPANDGDRLTFYVWEAREGEPYWQAGLEVPREGTVPGWVLAHRRPFVGSSRRDLRPFPVSLDAIRKEGMEASCVLPLSVRERAVGVLLFVAAEVGRYDDADLGLLEEVASVVAVALDRSLAYEEIKRLKDQLASENVYLHEEIETGQRHDELVGESPAILRVLAAARTVAPTTATVLLSGETGTGKGLIARALHAMSGRSDKPLVKVNCAALPAELVESELFGYERGAFTGAAARRIGRFELADGGTLFLDEIAELSLPLQAKLLSVLQDGEMQRLGGRETLHVDVRVIAATNRDLERAIAEGTLRSDLYYRLNVFPIHMPPLRERKDDIPLLVRHFVAKHGARLGRKVETIPRGVLAELVTYSWPGNVRELENLVERAVILSRGPRLDTSGWRLDGEKVAAGGGVATLDDVQRRHIVDVLEQNGWKVSGRGGAAELLGIKPTTLESRMKKLGIQRRH